jgi:long-subunit fatty acid transport protein
LLSGVLFVKVLTLTTALLGMALVSGSTFAETGYCAGMLGGKASGRGGAFAVMADDLTALYYNPAGLAKLDQTLLQVSNQLSYNSYDYTRAPTTDYDQQPMLSAVNSG